VHRMAKRSESLRRRGAAFFRESAPISTFWLRGPETVCNQRLKLLPTRSCPSPLFMRPRQFRPCLLAAGVDAVVPCADRFRACALSLLNPDSREHGLAERSRCRAECCAHPAHLFAEWLLDLAPMNPAGRMYAPSRKAACAPCGRDQGPASLSASSKNPEPHRARFSALWPRRLTLDEMPNSCRVLGRKSPPVLPSRSGRRWWPAPRREAAA